MNHIAWRAPDSGKAHMCSSFLSLGLFHSNQYNSTLFNGSLGKNFLKLYLGILNMKTWDIYVLVRLHVKYFETKCTFKTWQLFSSLFFMLLGPFDSPKISLFVLPCLFLDFDFQIIFFISLEMCLCSLCHCLLSLFLKLLFLSFFFPL